MDNDSKVSKYILESVMMHFSTMIKRMFIIIITEIILMAAITAGFLWYISLPVEEITESQVMENVDGNNPVQNIGDSYGKNGTD